MHVSTPLRTGSWLRAPSATGSTSVFAGSSGDERASRSSRTAVSRSDGGIARRSPPGAVRASAAASGPTRRAYASRRARGSHILSGRSSCTFVVEVEHMLLMGESINGTRKQVAEAIQARDAEFIKTLATDQVEAGAGLLDVNGGVAGGDEVADITWLIETVMSVTDMQLMVDSASPTALDAGVRAVIDKGGKVPFINSISGEQSRIDAVLPLVEKYKCPVVGLCLSDERED